eukprot:TRINITY_DN982_c4_g1_i1.p1 TRINITY_DN982_c4_g1~~TRINITY_DN982_c4_g1_i1.p1  ORF type:complete len:754 (+),score=242.72 TRINITY_DN982_c4_g1_i1:120-2381(+)
MAAAVAADQHAPVAAAAPGAAPAPAAAPTPAQPPAAAAPAPAAAAAYPARPLRMELGAVVRANEKLCSNNGWAMEAEEEGKVAALDDEGDPFVHNAKGEVSPEAYPSRYFTVVRPGTATVRQRCGAMAPGCVVTPNRELRSNDGWTMHIGEEGTVTSLDSDGDPFVINKHGVVSPEAYWSSDFNIVRYASSLLSPETVPPVVASNEVCNYRKGDRIKYFFRHSAVEYEVWMLCNSANAGLCTPRFGLTDGWVDAEVVLDFDASTYDPSRIADTGVLVRLHGGAAQSSPGMTLWWSRRGARCEPERLMGRVAPQMVCASPPPPRLSLFLVRWGGARNCDPVHHGDGGWGRTGSNVSDPYIRTLFDEALWPQMGTTYDCHTVFVSRSHDLEKVCPRASSQLMRGYHRCGMYFLWPCNYQDCDDSPGYVPQERLLQLMGGMEANGVHTRFPHYSHLYRLLLSKDWMSYLCMDRSFCCPATTKVAMAQVIQSPLRAARQALAALRPLRAAANRPVAYQREKDRGVVKLGFSWEAVDVKRWSGEYELADSLQALCEQRLYYGPSAMVQDYVDFDVEMRQFFVEATPGWDEDRGCPRVIQPRKTLYTRFNQVNDGRFTDFERLPRDKCLAECFFHDEKALADAERQATEIGSRVLLWVQTECAEPVPVLRVDTMVRRSGDGKAQVSLGEITELGGCFLGWPEGPTVVFNAVVRSCLRNTGPGHELAPPPPPPPAKPLSAVPNGHGPRGVARHGPRHAPY